MAKNLGPEKGGKDDGGNRWTRNSRTLSFWILFVLVSVLLVQLFSPQQPDARQLSYTEVRQQLAQGNIEAVTITDGKTVEGELRSPITTERGETRNFSMTLPIRDPEGFVAELEAAGVRVSGEETRQNWWMVIVGILPWILIIGIWIFMLRQMQAGGSKAFQFGKSKAKVLTADTPQVTFADVSGADEAKEELQEIIEFLKDPQRFTRLGGRLPKGALLVGPPGTGKTLLARAVAGEAGRPFFSMSGSDFVEMFVGVGASRVRDLFEQGKAHAPCIIFIDEIDAVGRHRGAGLGGGHDEREQTLNQLLVEMDGFESNEGVILIAATNRPDVLDPALLRPGRFDRQIVVDAPDVRGREGILRVHLRKVPLSDDVRVDALAKGMPGMSGADLANVVNEAALLAARRGRDKVTMADLEAAKDKIMLGTERRSLVLSEAERKLTAYHEAGHAVVALRVPGLDPLHKVTIVPRGRALGITASLPEEDRHSYSRDFLLAQLVMLYGGRAAEEMIFGPEKITTGAGNDIERATSLARRMVTQFGMSEKVGPMAVGDADHEVFLGRELVQRREVSPDTARLVDDELKRFLDEAYNRAVATLNENKDLLERIAEALLERETLDREEIAALAQGNPLPDMAPPEVFPASGSELAGTAGTAANRAAATDGERQQGEPGTSAEDESMDEEDSGDPGRREGGPLAAGHEARRIGASEAEADAS
jgi:cell division protease FtsH